MSKSIQRRDEAIQNTFLHLKEQGDDNPYARNMVTADFHTAWEIGDYDDDYDFRNRTPLSEEQRMGLLIRARRDAYAASLNAEELGRAVARIERSIASLRTLVLFIAMVVGSLAIRAMFT